MRREDHSWKRTAVVGVLFLVAGLAYVPVAVERNAVLWWVVVGVSVLGALILGYMARRSYRAESNAEPRRPEQ